MDAIRKALAVAFKDLQVLASDRAYVLSMVVFPLVVAGLNAAMWGGEESAIQLPAILVNQDSGPYGETLANALESIKEIALTTLDTPAAAEAQMADGKHLAAVLIPANFSRSIDDYQPVEITMIVDPAQAEYGRILTAILEEIAGALAIQGEIRYGIRAVLADMGAAADPAAARAAQAQVEGVLFTQLQRMETDAPVQVLKETLTGEHVFAWNNAVTLMLPGLTVMFAFFIVPALATELLKEKEAGSLRRLVAAPLPRAALIGGKVLAFLLVVLAQVTLLFGIGAVIMDMVLGRSALGLALVTLALGLSATTLGMLIAAVARSIDQAGSIGLLLIFLLGFLGGGFSPTNPPYRGEGFLAILSRLTPQANAQMAYHTLIIQNGGVGDVLLNVGYLLALSLVFFVIAVWRFRFE